jgi:hypothetical protein
MLIATQFGVINKVSSQLSNFYFLTCRIVYLTLITETKYIIMTYNVPSCEWQSWMWSLLNQISMLYNVPSTFINRNKIYNYDLQCTFMWVTKLDVVFTEPDINAVQCTFMWVTKLVYNVYRKLLHFHKNKNICYEIQLLKTPQKYLLNKVAITTWSKDISLLNCNQNYHSYKKIY